MEERRIEIRRALSAGTYRFSPVRAAVKMERRPSGEIKRRPLRISDIDDRVVQRAIARVVEPILTRRYNLRNDASFAYLKKRGVRDALGRMIALYRDKRPIAFEADLVDFFGKVDKEKLLQEMVFPALPDGSMNPLITDALAQEIGNRDELPEEDSDLFPEHSQGIPQGGGLSPLLANVYLSGFDQTMLAAGYGLVRYADDFIVLCRDEAEADRAYQLARDILEGQLRLQMHPLGTGTSAKTRIVRISRQHLEFLGVGYNGRRLWPSRKKLQRLHSRILELTEFKEVPNLLALLSRMKHLIEGWISAYCITDLAPYLESLERAINLRVGVCAYRMKWRRRYSPLTDQERRSSGIPALHQAWLQARENLKLRQQRIFALGSSGGGASAQEDQKEAGRAAWTEGRIQAKKRHPAVTISKP